MPLAATASGHAANVGRRGLLSFWAWVGLGPWALQRMRTSATRSSEDFVRHHRSHRQIVPEYQGQKLLLRIKIIWER